VYLPLDVVLSDTDVVQPDVIVICDPAKITQKNVSGAPDVVFEVLSPSTSKRDRWDKKRLYETYGVREYVIVDPQGQYVEHYRLQPDGTYHPGDALASGEELRLQCLGGLALPVDEIFGIGHAEDEA
jgi:Uma2 family endonuclease